MAQQIKPLKLKPAVGNGLDARSPADECDFGTWRYALNYTVTSKGKLCRAPGWDKLLPSASYNNQDLHDQLLSLTEFSAREPITFLFEAISTRKSTKLLAGTNNAIYALNNASGNYKIISDRLGSTDTRWKACALADTVIFTNNFNPVVYWQFDQGVTEADDQSVAQIPDLAEVGISKVKTVITWNDHVFLMNVVVNGSVQSGAVYWCNYQRPLDWIPNEGSTAGNFNLGYGETILSALPLSDRLMIFTTKGIWEVQAVGGQQVFVPVRRYSPQEGEACLFYPNTLISRGDELVYAGIDGIYSYSLYQSKPQRVEWIHNASSLMFDYINRSNCETHVASYNPQRKEIYFSFAKNDEAIPSETLVINSEYPWAYIIDHGFSAMVNYTAKSGTKMIRDFLLENCICSEEGLNTFWNQFTKEGGFCTEQETVTCSTNPASIFTTNEKTITYDGESVTTEDYDQAEADSDSLCVQLGTLTLSAMCESESRQDECNAGLRFVVASSTDYCLKEFSQNYYREKAITFTGCGGYERLGYKSLLRTGPCSFDEVDEDKEVSRFEIEATAVAQGTPSQFALRIGRQSQAIDPNFDDCGIIWDEQEAKDIICLSGDTVAGHNAGNTIPDDSYKWPVYYTGKYLYFELSIVNPNVSPIDTGGASCLSRITLDVRPIKTTY
jgi:hypothetical protein